MKNKNQNSEQKSAVQIPAWNFKRCFTIIILALFFSVNANAQAPSWEWAKGIGGTGDDVGDLTLDASGNIYMTGFFQGTVDFNPGVGVFNLTSAGSHDIFISKSDSSGNFLWAKRIGGTGDDFGWMIKLDNLGNIYITGRTSGTVDVDPGSGVFNITNTAYCARLTCKYDNDGNFIWAKTHTNGYDEEEALALDGTGCVYAAGYYWNTIDFDPGPGVYNLTPVGLTDLFIYKLDSSGNFAWAHSFGSGGTDLGWRVATDNSNNVYASGSFSGTVDFDPGPGVFNLTSKGGEDIYVLKLSSAGNFLWARGMGGTSTERPTGISIDPFGNVVSTGFFSGQVDFDPGAAVFNITPTTGWDCFISKLDSSGNFVWAKSNEGGLWWNWYYSDFDSLGNVYVLGDFEGTVDLDPGPGIFNVTSKGGWDSYIIKLDAAGNFMWGKTMGGTGSDICGNLVCDDAGQAYIALYSSSSSFKFDAITLTSHGSTDIFIAKLPANNIATPCSNINCTISPGVKSTNVSNTGCNNGTIKVNRGKGVYQAFPHIELYDAGNNLLNTVDLAPGTADYTFTNLAPGLYMIKVFDDSCCESIFYRNIKCRAPSSGFSATNITASSAQLNWNVVNCAVGYRILYQAQGTTTWSVKGVGTNTGLVNITGLQPNTTYKWKVASKCPGWPAYDALVYSYMSVFTTSALRTGEELSVSSTETFDISLYPNPATYTLTVNFESENTTAILQVANTVGQIVFEKQLNGADGIFEEQLDVSKLNTGMYVVIVETAQGVSRKKFAKE